LQRVAREAHDAAGATGHAIAERLQRGLPSFLTWMLMPLRSSQLLQVGQ